MVCSFCFFTTNAFFSFWIHCLLPQNFLCLCLNQYIIYRTFLVFFLQFNFLKNFWWWRWFFPKYCKYEVFCVLFCQNPPVHCSSVKNFGPVIRATISSIVFSKYMLVNLTIKYTVFLSVFSKTLTLVIGHNFSEEILPNISETFSLRTPKVFNILCLLPCT